MTSRQHLKLAHLLYGLGSIYYCLCFVTRCDSYIFQQQLSISLMGTRSNPHTSTTSLVALSDREREIRRKINQLKQQGYIKKKKDVFDGMDDDIDDDEDDNSNSSKAAKSKSSDYNDKIREKLGTTKSKLLGFDVGDCNNDDNSAIEDTISSTSRIPRIGSLSDTSSDEASKSEYERASEKKVEDLVTSLSLAVDDDDDDKNVSFTENDEQALIDLVSQKMQEKRDRENRERLDKLQNEARQRLEQLELERQQLQQQQKESSSSNATATEQQLTSGVGGSWTKSEDDDEATQDIYQPKTGSWGAFPRPRDISKAYGGGRRVGPGFSDEAARLQSEEETRERLKNYRVKMGIDFEAEKIHENEINEALQIANLAMQRGVYSTAVSALEKVTKYCSTNSKVGGKVFLELAMAYEAVGRTKEAITVYTTLSRSRIEKIKMNAKRLLYGIEAMQFMQETVGSSDFSRKKASSTFIDTTGLANIASKFDDRYETAYVDLSNKNYYKMLTQSVVRSPREARQILLMATGPGEVERMRIVQACRSLSRRFDEALQEEIDVITAKEKEPVAVMDGKPIYQEEPKQRKEARQLLQSRNSDIRNYYDSDELDDDDDEELEVLMALDEYVLKDAKKMKETLAGEWKLQLLADKRGDGVKFFNTSLAWQSMNTDTMSFTSSGPLTPFLSVQKSGNIHFNDKRRIVRRKNVEVAAGASWIAELFKGGGGAIGAISTPQQIVLIDSVLMMTRNVQSKLRRKGSSSIIGGSSSNPDDEKDYFAVWRRVEPGTYSSSYKI